MEQEQEANKKADAPSDQEERREKKAKPAEQAKPDTKADQTERKFWYALAAVVAVLGVMAAFNRL